MISLLAHINPQLNEIWRGKWAPGTIEPARYLYDHELVLVSKGSCRIEIGRDVHTLGAGCYAIVPPGKCHVTTTGPEGVFRVCLHFHWTLPTRKKPSAICCFHPRKPEHAELVRTPSFVPTSCFWGSFPPTGTVPALVETLFLRWPSGDGFQRDLCRAHFLELLTHLLASGPSLRRPVDRAAQLAYAVKELLETESRMPLQALLPSLGFTYAHLCRLFQKKFGVAPGDYRNSLRLERAKALLRNPQLTVAEVAYQSGFDDPAYFTRLFRRRNGASPSALR